MKMTQMKKVVSLIIALVMIASMAISAGALDFAVVGDVDGKEVKVAGGDVAKDPNGICYRLIRGVRYTFDIPNFHCGPSEEDPDAKCNGECVGVVVNSGPTGWKEKNFCLTQDEDKIWEFDLTEYAFKPGVDGAQGEGIDWMGVKAASWVKGNDGNVKIDILGEGGVVLAPGTGCDNEDCTGTINCGKKLSNPAPSNNQNNTNTNGANQSNNSNNSNSDGSKDIDTGVESIVLLGGVAVIAAGALIISRKRK
jgi:hypothetical protein